MIDILAALPLIAAAILIIVLIAVTGVWAVIAFLAGVRMLRDVWREGRDV